MRLRGVRAPAALSTPGRSWVPLGRDDVEAYAYYRVGYHRGLDRLRQSGWRGSGYVRWKHEKNRGFLRALDGLARAAEAIGETDEADRCVEFCTNSDPEGSCQSPDPRCPPQLVAAERTRHEARAHHRHHRPGRPLSVRVPHRQGVPGVRPRPRAGQPEDRDRPSENPALELVEGDLRDLSSLIAVVEQVQPDEVYNLGAISFVQLSFKQAELTAEITGIGVLRMLEAVRIVGGTENNPVRFYQASSSEMFGKVRETPQTETTPFHPRSPYGVAKVFGHYMTVNYRESYGMHACSGILFNHEARGAGSSS